MSLDSNVNFRLFSISSDSEFNSLALEIFRYQYESCRIYHEYVDLLQINRTQINDYRQIPFFPIEFFKTQEIRSGDFIEETVFCSSGTTGSNVSRHYVKDLKLYEESFNSSFQYFYGDIDNYCLLALLPSYLENKSSSLVYMVKSFIERTENKYSGFYPDDFDKLKDALIHLSEQGTKTILFGVSYALLDFANYLTSHNLTSYNLIVMETGGMKGRRKELVKEELHAILCNAFNVTKIHSEYGMTELLSQAYSQGEGRFHCPPWMKVLVRDINDPFAYLEKGKTGGLNIIDLANLHSCSFIETKDLCRLHDGDSFEILGRIDNSDLRGCNLLVLDL
jgi:phenylacetate-coenzyme A ligase PaaK-like adenylate-forming protein